MIITVDAIGHAYRTWWGAPLLRKHVGQDDDPENYRALFGFCFLNNLTSIVRILHREHPKFALLALC